MSPECSKDMSLQDPNHDDDSRPTNAFRLQHTPPPPPPLPPPSPPLPPVSIHSRSSPPPVSSPSARRWSELAAAVVAVMSCTRRARYATATAASKPTRMPIGPQCRKFRRNPEGPPLAWADARAALGSDAGVGSNEGGGVSDNAGAGTAGRGVCSGGGGERRRSCAVRMATTVSPISFDSSASTRKQTTAKPRTTARADRINAVTAVDAEDTAAVTVAELLVG
mmetsp:Transcript_61746/g.121270  ORF Transcript_61746/g.121270 Transcript_61746/m.121270 type:complete len:223 (+) Transcript_61746:145-813(+)